MFACQKCHRPMKLDPEQPLQESTLLAFKGSFTANDETKQKDARLVEALAESFVVLPSSLRPSPFQSQALAQAAATNMDAKVESLTNILLAASGKCEFDHPFCNECSRSVQKELEDRLRELETDREQYRNALRALQSSVTQPILNVSSESDEDAALAATERELEARLAKLQSERRALDFESRQYSDELATLQSFEQAFWREYQSFSIDYHENEKEKIFYFQQIENQKQLLTKLTHTSVLDDTFHIYFDGHFGTINGFRLGRLPSQPVDWLETNAGLGQLLLLLTIIASINHYQFQRYRLHPMGSFSKVSKTEEGHNTMYELYGSSDSWGPKLFWFRRFETALIGVLTCVKELGDFAYQSDRTFAFKYVISGDRVGDMSVKVQFHGDGQWTKAMKYLITNVKQLVIWSERRMKQMQEQPAMQS